MTACSPEPLALSLHDALPVSELTSLVSPSRLRRSRPVRASQSFTVLSPEPLATTSPWGRSAEHTSELYSPLQRGSRPLLATKNFTMLSPDPLATTSPCGATAN